MGKRLSLIYRISIVVFISTIIYNEYFIYTLNSWAWSELKCKNESNCVKVLLVADPQLIGEENENIHIITPLSIWDSDRFLQKTYKLVVDHLAPDVVIFLGDLLDEGSIADTSQYIRYLNRLFAIFTTEYPIKHIWLPGDNDIGGETDMVTEHKVQRFEAAFSQPPVIDVKHVRFSKVNRMIPDPPKSFETVDNNNEQISVIVSHMPLILVPATYVTKVLEVIRPKVIFAAHEHKSKVVQTNTEQKYRKISDLSAHDNQIHQYKVGHDNIIEFVVPTCSYRMGTIDIGYGAATIEGDGTLQYTVFWSPKRFVYLIAYACLAVLFIISIMMGPILKIFSRPRAIYVSKQSFPFRIIKNGV